jgi:4-amino-4-deoxy-L-arabinose transferase-like glycosyltransferase
LTRLAGPIAILVTGVAMLAWTWRTWPDPLVDFGREAYLAWQVSKGKTLYVDVAHFNGPFSVYLNAAFFRLFGTSILALALANAAPAAGCVAMLYSILVRVADRLAATLAGLTFVTVFACARFVRLGNYNWLCPYSYELPHGVMLGVAALWCLDRYHRTRRIGWSTATGAALGLTALTKTEPFVAAGLAVIAGLGLTLWAERPTGARLVRVVAAFAVGALVPLLATFLFFTARMPAGEVLRGPLGYWRAAMRPEFAALPMYREGLGIDDVPGNLGNLARATGWYALLLAPGVAAAIALRRGRPRAALTAVVAVVSMAAAALLVPIDGWLQAARPLPLFLLLAAVGSLAAFVRAREDTEVAARYAVQTALALFALVLLAKMVLNARVYHYGFALAMPATLVLVAALVSWAPALITRAGGDGRVLRAAAAGLLVVGLVAHLAFMQRLLARQTNVLGDGADAFYGDDRVAPLAELLDEIRQRVGPAKTLALLPEGVLLNYLARRESSVPYVQFSPVVMLLWGETKIARDFEASPPDFVALVHRDTSHEGARFFGKDYAQPIMGWVEANYRPVWHTGAPPLEDGRFGLVLLERNRLTQSTR